MTEQSIPLSPASAQALHHFGDPCIHCAIPHDDVPVGPCRGDPAKAIPIAYKSLGVRWDHVERFLVCFSNGRVEQRYSHISEHAPYWHFGYARDFQSPPRYDQKLTPADITP
jgi:hypothetical protein